MRLQILFFLGVFAFSSFGQTAPADDFKRFQIGVNFSPDITYRILQTGNASDVSMKSIVDVRNKTEIPKFGCTAGINFVYNIKRFVGVEIGIQYANKGYQSKRQDLVFASQLDSVWHTSSDYFKYTDNFHYIDIPVKVNFTVGKKKVRFFASVGFATNILVRAITTTVWTENGKKHSGNGDITSNFNRVNLSPMLSLGIDYKINSKMNFRAEPTFRFGALKITDTPITGFLYSGGVNLSYYFGL